MYKGKTENHPEYSSYCWKSKNELIRCIFNYDIYLLKKQNKIKDISLDSDMLICKIDDLNDLIKLQRDEITELTREKSVNKLNRKIRKTYLMKDNHNGLYKIGYSSNPNNRESTLQSEKPSINMVKVWDKNIESNLHNLYSKFRIRGEWFNLSKIQVKYICTHF